MASGTTLPPLPSSLSLEARLAFCQGPEELTSAVAWTLQASAPQPSPPLLGAGHPLLLLPLLCSLCFLQRRMVVTQKDLSGGRPSSSDRGSEGSGKEP